MHVAAAEDVEARRSDGGATRHPLTDALAATELAVNVYRVEPGKRLSGLHAHVDQEELFLVVAGTLTFETLDGTVEVGTEEVARFGPGEFQSARNAAGRAVEVYALGAPRDGDGLRVPLQCQACGYGTLRPEHDEDGPRLVCPECEADEDGSCPDCGSDEVLVTLEGESAVARCQVCEAPAWPRPPNRNH